MLRRLSAISMLWLLAAAALLLVPTRARAQVASGAIVGSIHDPAGAPLPGASVEVMNEGTGRRRLTVTEADGAFRMTTLPPGKYRLTATLDGYQQLVRQGVAVPTGDTVRVELALSVGTVSEAVTVTADAPLLRSA